MTKKTCGTCEHWGKSLVGFWTICYAPLPMWIDDGDRQCISKDTDATHCAAYRERGKEEKP